MPITLSKLPSFCPSSSSTNAVVPTSQTDCTKQEIPSLPSQEGDASFDIQSQPDNPTPTANTSNIPSPTIEITSLHDVLLDISVLCE